MEKSISVGAPSTEFSLCLKQDDCQALIEGLEEDTQLFFLKRTIKLIHDNILIFDPHLIPKIEVRVKENKFRSLPPTYQDYIRDIKRIIAFLRTNLKVSRHPLNIEILKSKITDQQFLRNLKSSDKGRTSFATLPTPSKKRVIKMESKKQQEAEKAKRKE